MQYQGEILDKNDFKINSERKLSEQKNMGFEMMAILGIT